MNSFHCFDAPVLSPIKSLRRVGIGMFSFLKAVHGKWIWKDCIRINNYNKSVHAGTHTHTDTFTHTAGSALDKHWDNGVMAAAISKGAQLHFVKYRISTKNTFMITQKFRINRYLSVSEKGRKQNSKSLHMWQGEKHGNLPYAKASRQNSKLAKAFDTVQLFKRTLSPILAYYSLQLSLWCVLRVLMSLIQELNSVYFHNTCQKVAQNQWIAATSRPPYSKRLALLKTRSSGQFPFWEGGHLHTVNIR